MEFATTIIHIVQRQDRRQLVDALRRSIPGATITHAIIPLGEDRQDRRAIRGAAASHLAAVKLHMIKSDLPLLVLEDDATIHKEGFEKLLSLEASALPSDCAVLLVGSETPIAYATSTGYYEVLIPFHGAHGVLYNTPVIKRSGWLMEAWMQLAIAPLGDDKCCFEGIIDAACRAAKVRIYRPEIMAFGTAASPSSRDKNFNRARICAKPGELPLISPIDHRANGSMNGTIPRYKKQL